MEVIDAYHITNKANVRSILVNGLVPSIGLNSSSVNEKRLLTYFTTVDCIDRWFERFHINKDDMIVLKFPCNKYGKRYDTANDFFTSEFILPQKISVVNGEEKSLEKYYQENKYILDLMEERKMITTLKTIIDRLNETDRNDLTPEEGWDYNETEPNIIETVELLKIISYLNDKSNFTDIVLELKDKTLKKIISNDLGVTIDSEIYKLFDIVFDNSLSKKSKIDMFTLNLAEMLLSINLYYRQVDRYNRTGKKVGDDNTRWSFSEIEEDIFKNNKYVSDLFVETKELYKNRLNSFHK